MRNFAKLVVGMSVGVVAAVGNAAPVVTVGADVVGLISASENFEGFAPNSSPGGTFNSGGFTFSLATLNFVIWSGPGTGLPTQNLYQNGGATAMTRIQLSNVSDDMGQLAFDIGNGFGGMDPQFVWLRTYLNGAPTGFDFDFTLSTPSRILVSGGGFDEVRVQAYGRLDERDLHTESTFGAVAIDNVVASTEAGSTSVPEPGTFALFAVGLAGLGFRARRKH